MRNLCDYCKECEDNKHSISYCADICTVPLLLLEQIEKNRKENTEISEIMKGDE